MKKTIAILLVAVLAMCSVFAEIALGGEAVGKFEGNFDDKTAKFVNAPDVKLTLDANSSEKVYEGDVYAGIKATLKFKIGPVDDVKVLAVDKFEISDAYITDGSWKVSITSAAKTATFAKGWETIYDKANDADKNPVLANTVGNKYTVDSKSVSIPGVTVEVAGWKAGIGLDAKFDGAKNGLVTLATPSFTFDAVSVKGGVGASNLDGSLKVGGGAEAKYATDAFSATVAADMVYGKKNNTFDAAVSAKVVTVPVTVDAYYATKTDLMNKVKTYVDRYFATEPTGDPANKFVVDNYLSARAVASFAIKDQPVKVTLVGLDLINRQYLDLEATSTFKGVETYVNGGYEVKNSKTHLGIGASYNMDKVGKVYGGVGMSITSAQTTLKAKVGIENKVLVSGATLKAEYATGDLLGDAKFGKVTASAKVSF